MEDKRVNGVTVNFFTSLLYKTDIFHVALRLFSKRSQKTSKYDTEQKGEIRLVRNEDLTLGESFGLKGNRKIVVRNGCKRRCKILWFQSFLTC